MTNDSGNLSIDFLAGITIFIVAFIWVATMIPGLMIGVTGSTIDFDAVAYRTGVILVEDPGMPASPGWETKDDNQTADVQRFGLAVSKDTPNLLAPAKVDRFFCSTAFIYPDDYHSRAIFGNYPYRFNISLQNAGSTKTRSIGDIKPDGYGYIRRLVKIREVSNTTIGKTNPYFYNSTANVTYHVFTVHINNTKLLEDIKDPAYQIDPLFDQIMINITDLQTTINFPPTTVYLDNITICLQNLPSPPTCFRTFNSPYIDGNSTPQSPPLPVNNNVSIIFPPGFFSMASENTQLYIKLNFNLTPAMGFLNNTVNGPFEYDYNPTNVTQPFLRDAVMEVAVW